MSKSPIGPILRQIVDEKSISNSHLIQALGVSKQAMYNSFKRTDMRNEEIEKWAEILGVTKEEIIARWRNEDGTKSESKSESNYLMEHLANLEEQFKRLLGQLEIKDKQLEVKDQQMAGLQKTVDVLLGKSDVIEDVTCRVLNSLSGQMVA